MVPEEESLAGKEELILVSLYLILLAASIAILWFSLSRSEGYFVLGFVRELRVFSQWELGKNYLSSDSTKPVRVLSSSSLVVDLE